MNDCPFRYQGQYLDSETGLYYNRFRYYDPEIGNYISQDPIGLAGGLKMYSYALNPTTRLDVFGLFHHTDTGHNVYGLYDVIGKDAMGNEILAFQTLFVDFSAELQDELYIDNMEESEDGIEDIANWIVSNRKDYYDKVLSNPNLVPYSVEDKLDEDLCGVADEVFVEKFSESTGIY